MKYQQVNEGSFVLCHIVRETSVDVELNAPVLHQQCKFAWLRRKEKGTPKNVEKNPALGFELAHDLA
jgi:hypothetical protein